MRIRVARGRRHVGDAGDALQLVDDVQRGVVGEVQGVEAAVGRVQGDDVQDVGRALLHGHAIARDLLRQPGRGQLHAVVDVEHGLVDVGADFERDDDTMLQTMNRVEVEHFSAGLLLDGADHWQRSRSPPDTRR
jgi:hypothetical protein